MNTYEWLISRLDAFIRKYYMNRVIRGTLIFLICVLLYVLTVTVGEYYLYMPVWLRVSIVSVFLLLGGSTLVAWVVIPLSKMWRLGKVLSYEQAADIVGKYFPEISDRLLNILQLKKQDDTTASKELIEAGINQKISQIAVIPITSAIDLSKNKKYLPYLLPVVLAGVFILVAAPNVFREGTSRLLQPTTAFEKPSPFKFIIKNDRLLAIRNTDFVLSVETKGSALPAEAFIEVGGEQIPMQQLPNHTFQYTFKNVTAPVDFKFYAAGFYSHDNTLQVVQKPVLKSFKVALDYPAYIGKKDEVRNSLSDMTVPVGTKIQWSFLTEYTDDATIRFGSGTAVSLSHAAAMFGYEHSFMSDTDYTITLHNSKAGITDSFRYHVQVIPDQYPVIQLQEQRDTVSGKQILLTGTAGDDYGITRVLFNYSISNDKGQALLTKSIPLQVKPGALTTFQYYFDIEMLNMQPGQKIAYYIEAWDNDGVHGSKASRSEVMTYQMYDAKQIDSAINENSQQINSGLSNSAEKTQELQSDYKDMQSKMLQSDKMDWQQQQSLQEMMKKQQELQNKVENVKKRFDEQVQQSEQKKYSEDVKEKQDEIKKQLDNLLNDELKKEMEKLQELMKKLNKDQAVDAMEKMQQDNKLFDMDMKRMQEEMKRLEMQMRMEDMANKMDELAKKETELKTKTDDAKKDNAELSKEQKDIKDQLDKALQEDMKDMKDLAKETKQEKDVAAPQEAGKDAQKDMQDSKQSLDQKQNSKASKSQKAAADNLKKMAESLRSAAGGMGMEQIDIDIHATRQILSNLIRLSFDQEDLMKSVKHTSTASQEYVRNQEEQNRLHGNSYMIRDSLFELSKRIPKLPAFVNRETTDLEYNMKKSVDALENRNVGLAQADQQYVMTHTNNLALMLNEVLANLIQQQNQSQQQGNGSCSKPGGKKPKPGPGNQLADIITQQEQLGSAMQQMQRSQDGKQGKKGGKQPGKEPGKQPGGKQPGGKQPGGKDGSGESGGQGSNGNGQGQEGESNNEYGDAEQLARLAQQQAAIRRQLQDLTNELNSKGMGNNQALRDVQQKMDKTETDIVNRRFSAEMLQRQREIQTRLLEAEKSLREQEQDDKRASKTTPEMSRPVPPELQKYITNRSQMLELYKTVPPQLKPYYKDMVEHYFQMIGSK